MAPVGDARDGRLCAQDPPLWRLRYIAHMEQTPASARCIWCGKATNANDDGASFLFLAKREGNFTSQPANWLDQSPHIEGHQFFCHVACFRASVPEGQKFALELALDMP